MTLWTLWIYFPVLQMRKREDLEKLLVRKEWNSRYDCLLLTVSKGAMIDPWSIPGNVALRELFILVINDFVIYTWSSRPCPTVLSGCFAITSDWWYVLGFIVGSWFLIAMADCVAGNTYATSPRIKALDPETQRVFPGQRHSRHVPMRLC